jgi:hypothetical protein
MSKKGEETAVLAEGENQEQAVQVTETGRVSQEQIDAWKKEHQVSYIKEVCVNVSEKEKAFTYLKEPNRDVIALALAAPKDQANRNSKVWSHGTVVLNNCRVGGDDRINTDNKMYFAVVVEAASMIDVYETESKNL